MPTSVLIVCIDECTWKIIPEHLYDSFFTPPFLYFYDFSFANKRLKYRILLSITWYSSLVTEKSVSKKITWMKRYMWLEALISKIVLFRLS